MANNNKNTISAFEILAQAFFLFKKAPMNVISIYYIGSIPFMAVMIYFFTGIINSLIHKENFPVYTLLLTLTFGWMKYCHSVFSLRINEFMNGIEPVRLANKLKVFNHQLISHGLGLIFLPIGFLTMFLYPIVLAFLQNISVDGFSESDSLRTLIKNSFKKSVIWYRQNYTIVWLTNPYAFFIIIGMSVILTGFFRSIAPEMPEIVTMIITLICFIPLAPIVVAISMNALMVFYYGPYLLKSLLNVDSIFSIASLYLLNNTLFIVIGAVVFLLLDPVVKITYVIRNFYIDSIKTGSDLKNKIILLKKGDSNA